MTDSKYVYPGTDTLMNKAGIRNYRELALFESLVSTKRLAELHLTPITGDFDLSHLQDIHHYIFQDVYPFAGQIRTENIAKDNFRFAPTQFIEPAAQDIFGQLQGEGALKGMPAEQFAERAAYYMAEINVLHPFREGNGRSTREFIRELANNAGFDLQWSRVDKDRVFQASVRSIHDTTELEKVIKEAITPRPVLLKELLKNMKGMPDSSTVLSAEILNTPVIAHRSKGKYYKSPCRDGKML